MLRSNLGLVLGGLAAMALGLVSIWALFALPPLGSQTPSRLELASLEAPSPPVGAPTLTPSDPGARNDEAGRPRLHLDGERSTFSFDGEKGGLYIDKDRLSLRTPFGKFNIDW
jgi:hypothetical protein